MTVSQLSIEILSDLQGVDCTQGPPNDWDAGWPSSLQVTVGSTGSVSITCVRVPAAILTLTWTNNATSFQVYNPLDCLDGCAPYRPCFAGLQPGPTYTCEVEIPVGAQVEIHADGPFTAATSWGGACAGAYLSVSGRLGVCALTMDASKHASLTT